MSQLLGKVIFLKEYLRKWCKIYNFVPEASSSPKHLSFNYVNVPIYGIWEKAENVGREDQLLQLCPVAGQGALCMN